jgi:thymidine phosphorylase
VDLTIDLCATLLLTLCGSETDEATTRRETSATRSTSGAAADRFGRMVAALGVPRPTSSSAGATTSRKPP